VAREKLTRAEQRFNYAIAVAAVLVVALLIVFSPQVRLLGAPLPVLPLALLIGAFLFGLGQMLVGLSRRRRFLRSFHPTEEAPRGPRMPASESSGGLGSRTTGITAAEPQHHKE
jgi:hypothetical protein